MSGKSNGKYKKTHILIRIVLCFLSFCQFIFIAVSLLRAFDLSLKFGCPGVFGADATKIVPMIYFTNSYRGAAGVFGADTTKFVPPIFFGSIRIAGPPPPHTSSEPKLRNLRHLSFKQFVSRGRRPPPLRSRSYEICAADCSLNLYRGIATPPPLRSRSHEICTADF